MRTLKQFQDEVGMQYNSINAMPHYVRFFSKTESGKQQEEKRSEGIYFDGCGRDLWHF